MPHQVHIEHVIRSHLDVLCNQLGNRHVGSAGNQAATSYFVREAISLGFRATCSPFPCLEWEPGEVILEIAGALWEASAGPYSLPCDVYEDLVCISTLQELEEAPIEGKLVLLHGEIASEPFMPKSFVFYNPDMHKQIVSLLESKMPAALIAATGKSPGTAGSVYPFPLFEDGDFDIPFVVMKDVDGDRLRQHAGKRARLYMESKRIPASACNPVADKGPQDGPRILLCAHIDTKKNTPGALDNGTGVAVLLAVAKLLEHHSPKMRLELVAFNGEDYYSVPGQMLYLEELGDRMDEVALAINIDCAGHVDSRVEYSFYNLSRQLQAIAEAAIASQENAQLGESWFQSDHAMFSMAGRPAMAVTSSNFAWLCQEITHTPKDTTALVDVGALARTAHTISSIARTLTS